MVYIDLESINVNIDATSYQNAIKCIIYMPLKCIVSIELLIKTWEGNESPDKYLHLTKVKGWRLQWMQSTSQWDSKQWMEWMKNIFGEMRANDASATETDNFFVCPFQMHLFIRNDSTFRMWSTVESVALNLYRWHYFLYIFGFSAYPVHLVGKQCLMCKNVRINYFNKLPSNEHRSFDSSFNSSLYS